jgi:succinate dehydrogenase/fumarate reductase flavoprotein subunit
MRGKGVGLVTHFVKALLARGVPIRLGAAVHNLTVAGDRVTGVRMADGTALAARKGVVLATGGYEWNADLMADFDPIPGLQPLSPRSSTGDGLIMGAEIGAAIRRIQNNLSLMLGFYLVPDEPSHEPIQCMAGISEMCSPHTIVVNKAGQRFADESYFQSVVPALRRFDTLKHDYANLPCFLIFDRQFLSSYALAHLPIGTDAPESVARADTLPELAGKLGIDAACLEQTVQRFNRFAAAGHDEDFQRGELRWRLADRSAEGRRNPSLGSLDQPPFYGLELRPSLGTTSAGLLADANGQVLHQRRHPIPGLYASGVVAVRNELGAGYQAGLNLASAMTFSLLAVRHMRGQ